MIIWINGAFGSGKTQTAFELNRRIADSYVYDPENAGYFIWKNVPEALSRKGDFQDIPLWRSFNYDLLSYIADSYSGVIIVPMTVVNKSYYDEIIGNLSKNYEVLHFILYASKETLIKRLAKRFENENSWAAMQIDRCISAFDNDISEQKIVTDNMSIGQVAEYIANATSIELEPDNRNRARKKIDRLITQFKHIRS